MSAHPQLTVPESNEIVKYILSLTETKKQKVTIPLNGTVALKDHKENEPLGTYTLTATYTDKGANGIGALTKTDVVTLRNAKVKTVYTDAQVGFARFGNSLSNANHKSYILLKNIDLTGIKKFAYEYASANRDGEIIARIDSQAGPIISSIAYKATGDWKTQSTVTSVINEPVSGRHDVYFFVMKRDKPNEDIINLKSILFE